jgi:hypothetical protein
VRRTGLGRHGGLDDAAGDPLDGLVNLFDVGIVLAVAFLVAGLGLARGHDRSERARQPQPQRGSTVPLPAPTAAAPRVSGRGEAVGQVYRLPDGRLVLVRRGR